MSNNNNVTIDFSFFGLLTILFIALKLIGYVNWSWLWVLAPLWIPLVIVVLLVLIYSKL